MQLWLDPVVRTDCGDALAPAASFANSQWRRYDDATKAGLILSGVGEACLDEMGSCSGAGIHARGVFQQIRARDWENLSEGMEETNREDPQAPRPDATTVPKLTLAAVAAVSLALRVLDFTSESQDSTWGGGGRQRGDDELLEGILGGALQVGCALGADPAERRNKCIRLRLGMLALAACGGESWKEACARDEVFIVGGATAKAMTNADYNKVPRGMLSADQRALCSWAMEQPEVRDARTSAKKLFKTLKRFKDMSLRDKEVQTHYKSVLSTKEWERDYGWTEKPM